MGEREKYRQFLDGLQLRWFDPEEILSYADRVNNTLPPQELWYHIVPTLWVVDQVRNYLAKPVTLTSIYRSPEYNASVGGASQSYHMRNCAIDFQVEDVSPSRIHEILLNMRASGSFRGGVGRYSSFNHIDTRGHNATWT